jgi:hypothetical protein
METSMYEIIREDNSVFMRCNSPETINWTILYVPEAYRVRFPDGEIMDLVKASYYLESK